MYVSTALDPITRQGQTCFDTPVDLVVGVGGHAVARSMCGDGDPEACLMVVQISIHCRACIGTGVGSDSSRRWS
jgi:hypothetical protein